MKFLQVETGGDVRQWDTFIVPVPDDWDDDAEDRDARLRELIWDGKAQHQSTEYEDAGDTLPPVGFVVNEVTQATAAALT
ncbi:hypothetical protein [Nocardia sp. NBC_01388]|uniref:hypothetical protein n=1 Tax=Nocardia sp. NBC_01388 TaxID=2903596 RepID=UPI002F909E65